MATRISGVDNAPHVVGTGENRIMLVLPDVYSSIGASVGVQKLSGDPPSGVHSTSVGEAIKDGTIRKVKISYIGANTKRKTATLVVAAEKAMQVRASLIGSTYQGYKIRTAYFPTRIQLG